MPNITGLLYIGRNALVTQQKAIDITGNNIANVNTKGYSRQRLNMEQSNPIRDNNTTMSTGVRANQKIQRYYDQFCHQSAQQRERRPREMGGPEKRLSRRSRCSSTR